LVNAFFKSLLLSALLKAAHILRIDPDKI